MFCDTPNEKYKLFDFEENKVTIYEAQTHNNRQIKSYNRYEIDNFSYAAIKVGYGLQINRNFANVIYQENEIIYIHSNGEKFNFKTYNLS